MLVQACLNGGRSKSENAAIPVTIAKIAADAAAVRRAGAAELHVHVRNPAGDETIDAVYVGACVSAIRKAAPGMPIGVSTAAWIRPGGRARLDLLRQWDVLPDYVSVNLNEDDAPEVMDIMLEQGIGIEAGIWTRDDAFRFVSLQQGPRCLRFLVETISDDPEAAMQEYVAIMEVLGGAGFALPVLLHGDAGSAWPMVAEAARRGYATRIGFEDSLVLPDGSLAPDNAALVAAAVGIMEVAPPE